MYRTIVLLSCLVVGTATTAAAVAAMPLSFGTTRGRSDNRTNRTNRTNHTVSHHTHSQKRRHATSRWNSDVTTERRFLKSSSLPIPRYKTYHVVPLTELGTVHPDAAIGNPLKIIILSSKSIDSHYFQQRMRGSVYPLFQCLPFHSSNER
jgi:hypothetical protein